MTHFDTLNILSHNKDKDEDKEYFSSSEESIINQFTMNRSGNIPQEFLTNKFYGRGQDEKYTKQKLRTLFENGAIHCNDNKCIDNAKHERKEDNMVNYSKEHLLNKIRNLENEKKYLLKFLEDKKNQEVKYKQALEIQVAKMNSENKKYEFYEQEWLKFRSLEYYLLNTGKAPLRHLLEKHYNDDTIYEKFGNLTRTQESLVVNLIEDHKKLLKEKKNISKKYHDAVDSNFQLYQQNEMLKVQNTCLLDNNKDKIHEELEKKMSALNAALIHTQKENIEMREILDQYSRLITNIKQCSEMSDIMTEIDKFGKYITI